MKEAHKEAKSLLMEYFDSIGFHHFVTIKEVVPNIHSDGCSRSGFCNAYILKYALDLYSNRGFDPSSIEKFSQDIERDYKMELPVGPPEIEFGDGTAPLLGGLGGALVGGMVAGPGGALVGGLTGAAVGGLAGSRNVRGFSRFESQFI
jgi:hypothetical protein